MKIAVVGAGFGGLTIAYRLAKRGHSVTVYESEDRPGGLAMGFSKPGWKWSIENHYHHWFTNDRSVLSLAKEIGYNVYCATPKTSTYIDGKIYKLDTPLALIGFNAIPLIDRVRTGLVLLFLKLTNSWKMLESVTAKEFILKYMGPYSWAKLWGPLFIGKFSTFATKVSASWFWARIKKRTQSLCYPEAGFASFANKLADECIKKGVKVEYKTLVNTIKKSENGILVKTGKNAIIFDKVVCTLPFNIFTAITHNLSDEYKNSLNSVRGLGAVNLLLSLNKKFFDDGTYWLNINDKKFPFLAVVEHTNFMNASNYSGEHLLYIGNYLPQDHKYFSKTAESLISEFLPYLKKINSDFNKKWINDSFLFKAKFAQPIFPLNYSKIVPDFKTPIEGLYLCNMSQVYPWDRGTNYAVENGEKVAEIINNGK